MGEQDRNQNSYCTAASQEQEDRSITAQQIRAGTDRSTGPCTDKRADGHQQTISLLLLSSIDLARQKRGQHRLHRVGDAEQPGPGAERRHPETAAAESGSCQQ